MTQRQANNMTSAIPLTKLRGRVLRTAALLWLACMASVVQAQDGLFDPVKIVNDRIITRYELNQRVLFMQLLRQQGDLPELALNDLIDDRLRMSVAEQIGLAVTPDALATGMAEFASRANLTTEEFLTAIAQGGVDPQGFRDFVEAGLVWRDVVRAKFGPSVKVSEVAVDRAIAAGAVANGPVKVLVSEILLRSNAGDGVDAQAVARQLKADMKTETGFADAARRLSKAETSVRGGRMEWQSLSQLPPAAGPMLMAMKPGEVTDPIAVPGGVVVYFLRRIGQEPGDAPTGSTLDYAQVLLADGAGTAAEIARLRANTDTCDDLYGQAGTLPADRLLRDSQPSTAVPSDIAAELAKLDVGESSVALRRGGAVVFLMLCSRNPTTDVPPDRDEVRSQLLNIRLAALAESYLAELRADAILRDP